MYAAWGTECMNPRKYKGSGGGCHPPLPKVFLIFSLDDKTSAPEVFCSCSFILRAHFETSLVAVSYYGYEIWRHKWQVSSHFWVKMHVFQLFWKVKLVDEMMQSNYLCVILHVKRKKLLIHSVFTWFLILDKIQDGDHVWWRHRPPAAPPPIKYTSFCREDQRLSTEGKIVSK